MKDENKTKAQLISELADLRRRNAELARSKSLYRPAVEKRKESEESLQTLFKTMSEGVVLIDSNGLIVEANASATRIAGLKRNEIVGKRCDSPDWKLLRPDGTRMPPKEMAGPRTMKEKRPIKDLIMGVERPDGGISWINTNTTPIIDEIGKLDSIVLTFSDITQHKQAEDELRNSEERLKLIFEFAPDAYYMTDIKGNFVDGNKAAERLTGYKRKDLIGKNFMKLNLLTSKQIPKAAGLLAKNLLGQPTGPDEFAMNRKDGTQVHVEISTYPVKIKDKTLVLGIARDISDRKHDMGNLRKSEASLSEAQRIAHLGNWDWNIQNNELSWSDEIYRIFGLKPQKFGATYEAFLNSVHPDDREFVNEAVNKAVQRKKPYSIDHRIVLPNGSERVVHEQAKVFFNDKGKATRMLGTVQDITGRKRAEEALQRAHHELELRVEERTAELKATNEALIHEISVREEAEKALKLDEERLEVLLRLSHIEMRAEEKLTDFALEEGVRLTQSKVGYLHFFSEDQKSIQLYSWSKKTLKECKAEQALHSPLDKAGIWADCIRIRRPVIHNDYQSMPNKKGYSEGHFPVIRHMSIPVYDGSRIIGIAGVGNKKEPYNQSDVRQLSLFMNSMWEILKRKRAEEALKESEERYRNIVELAIDIIYRLDAQGNIIFISRGVESLGYTPEMLIGTKFKALVHPDDLESSMRGFAERRTGSRITHNLEFRMLEKQRIGNTLEYISVSVTARGLWDTPDNQIDNPKKKFIGTLGIIRDITAIKQVTEELQKSKEAAEIASRAKSDFLANMSHELRTPLNAVIGFSEVLEDQAFGELNEKQRRYVSHIQSSGKHLLSLINDILDLAKVEAGKTELDFSAVKIAALLERCLVLIKEKALKHGIGLKLRIPKGTQDLTISADERRLMQVIFNLLSNASKFTPDGGVIELSARQNKKNVLISVSDNGIGIKKEDLEGIFNEFEQVDSSLGRKHKGTGLGLALSRKIVELHGGRIWAKSEGEGMGSQFTFSIPMNKAEKK